MQIQLDGTVGRVTEPSPAVISPKASAVPSVHVQVPAPPTVTQTTEGGQTGTASASKSEPLLSFQRDLAGRLYYVVSDAHTGEEIAQIPSEQLRNVGEGIADYLKKLGADHDANTHIAIKA